MASRRLIAFASKCAWRSGTGLPISLLAVLVILDRFANQPASSLGDLGQSCLVLFFEAAEKTKTSADENICILSAFSEQLASSPDSPFTVAMHVKHYVSTFQKG